MYKRLIALILLSIFLLPVEDSKAAHQHHVLFIASYHPAFPTFFEQVQGIESVLVEHGAIVDTEFMDSKRFNDEGNLNNFYNSLSYKLSQEQPYDAVIVADDSALEFALAHQSELFSNIPIVFFGINNIDFALAQNQNPWVSGVIEAVSMGETIELMTILQPDLENVVAIVDNTNSGQGDLVTFYETAATFPNLTFTELSLVELSFAELANQLQQLDEHSSVLLLSAYNDRNGENLEFADSLALALENSTTPIYHLWYHGMGEGLVGGKLISHFEQGRTAAQMVLEILDGQPISSMPVLLESPNRYVLDYVVLQQWDMDVNNIPPDTIILNQPFSLYSQYKTEIWGTLGIVVGLLLLVIALIYTLMRQRQAERQLRQSEQKYRAYVNSAPYGVVVTDLAGHCLETNQTAASLTGYSASEMLSFDLNNLIFPNLSVNVSSFLQQVAEQGNGEYEIDFERLDGTSFDMQVRAVKIENDKLLIYFSDQTKRKQAEKDLQVSHEQLEQTLKQLQETQEQLITQERLAAVGQLSAGIAHDFNNILASILLYAQLTQQNPNLPTNTYRYLDTIVTQSERAAQLVQQILDFSRRSILSPQPLNLSSFLKETVQLLKHTLPEYVTVTFTQDDGEHCILADLSRTEQVIVNLALNACNAMPNGGQLDIQLFRTDAETEVFCTVCDEAFQGTWVGVHIKDTGTGIPDDVLAHIFEPFFTTHAPSGSGLGLAQVYGIIQQHNGHILVETAVTEGTSFYLYWPAFEQSDIAENPSLPENHMTGGIGQTVLVVEDNSAVREAIVKTLTMLEYQPVDVDNAEKALELLKKQSYAIALVICDWVLPGMSGLSLSQQLVDDQIDVPILVMTGHPLNEQEDTPPNIMGWLTKPIGINELAMSIKQVLELSI